MDYRSGFQKLMCIQIPGNNVKIKILIEILGQGLTFRISNKLSQVILWVTFWVARHRRTPLNFSWNTGILNSFNTALKIAGKMGRGGARHQVWNQKLK